MRKFFTLSFLLISSYVLAQSNFISGSIVTAKGDTLQGLIDYQDWERNPPSIKFKKNDTVEELSPNQIKNFSVSERHYVSNSLPVIQAAGKMEEMSPAPKTKIETVFLELLFSGTVNLYFLKDRNSIPHFFYQSRTGEIIELNNFEYKKVVDEKELLVRPKRYLGQLSALMGGCISIAKSPPVYTTSSLQTLFEKYNNCISPDSKTSQLNKKRRLILEPGIVLGVSATTFVFSFTHGFNDEKIKFSPSIKPVAGASLDIVLPFANRRWSIHSDLLYRSYSTETNRIYSNGQEKIKYSFSYSGLKLANALRFQYGLGGVKPFFLAGFFNGISLSRKNTMITERTLTSVTFVHESDALGSTRSHEFGFLFGAGVQYNRISAEVRYEQGNGISNATGYGTKTKASYFLIQYKLINR